MRARSFSIVTALSVLMLIALTLLLPPTLSVADAQPAVAQPSLDPPPILPGQVPHPILGDTGVRHAIALCTDRPALIASLYPFLDAAQQQSLLSDTFLPKAHWAYDPTTVKYPYDPAQAQQLLAQAGWTLAPGATYRQNSAGKELALTLTTTNASWRQAYAAAWAVQLRGCGIRLTVNPVSSNWFLGQQTGLQRRQFELASFAWVAGPEPDGRSLYACDQIPMPSNGWSGQNIMAWCNPKASAAVITATTTLTRSERIAAYATVQQEFAKDMISLPLFQRVEFVGAATGISGLAPSPTEYWTWNAEQWQVSGRDTITAGIDSEPASLFPLLDESYEASLVASLIYGRGLTTLDYDYQARLYISLPTLENGGALNQTVVVNTGAIVVDAYDNVGPLAAGMRVVNAAGQQVTYAGGPANMKQLSVTTSYLPGLKWPDGSPLVQADLQLWDGINCDPATGAASWQLHECQRTWTTQYTGDTTVRYTLLPGYQPEEYFTRVPGAYPSQRMVSGGRKLQAVPASEWATLPEITTSPWGLGPYHVSSWQKGQAIVLDASPNYGLGAPKIAHIKLIFVGYGGAVPQLVNGSLDILDKNAITPSSDSAALLDAAHTGHAQAFMLASPTWEHADMNLALLFYESLPILRR